MNAMKVVTGVLLLGGVVASAQTPPRRVIDFESDKVGQAPAGFTFALRASCGGAIYIVDANNYYIVRANALEGNVVL